MNSAAIGGNLQTCFPLVRKAGHKQIAVATQGDFAWWQFTPNSELLIARFFNL